MMLNSIKTRLTLTFVATLSIVGLITSGIAFYDTYRETHELQDDLLRQISSYINPKLPPQNRPIGENDARIFVYILDPQVSLQLPQNRKNGFYTLRKEGTLLKVVDRKQEKSFLYNLTAHDDSYRAFVRMTPFGQVVIMQENDYREGLAVKAAWASVLPLIILLALIPLLIVVMVQLTMRPIARLSRKVETREQHDLTPLPMEKIPTEVRGFVSAINQLLGRTNAFVQQQKRFIADASHELRSPMTALSLQAERLHEQPLPAEAKMQLNQLQQGIRRSRDLLEQLLSLARIQNRMPNSLQAVSIQSIFTKVIEDLYPLAEQKSQDIGVTSNSDVLLQTNETDLYLLIKTLADNAIRYTPVGSQIDLSAQETTDEVILCVEDNGNGIPATERQRVLEPFYRILGSDQQGSGLGLAIAANIVQNYHGSIQLGDSPHFEHGLLVRVTFPR